jgi:phage terminase Nu1 subunit (DNA packaging protein)
VDLTIAQIAEMTGKTKRTIANWIAKEGMPTHETHAGRETTCPAKEWLDWYIKRATATDYNAERTRLTKEQADKEEMANAVRRGELLEASEVGDLWEDLTLAARAKFLALATRVAPLVQATDGEFNSIKNVIDAGVREALDELSYQLETTGSEGMESTPETDS